MLVNLKAAFAARRTRQVDLAMTLEIAPTVLSEIINGRRKASSELRLRIAKALNANEDWLFAGHTRIPGPGSSMERAHDE